MLKVGDKFRFKGKVLTYIVLRITVEKHTNEYVIHYMPCYMLSTCFLETELKFTDNGKTKYKII